MVKDFLDQERNNGKWRKWKDLGHNNESPLKAQVVVLAEGLNHRRTLISSFPDQLRWGKNTEGNFNLKEAKHEIIGFNYVGNNIEKVGESIL